ncbi:HD domain-containing protein [Fervidicoccus sp.]|uniref:HD domain-containing protein n=1 Tax=Fervidicoccus sp. TaxID=2060324 RepID=UPI003D0AA072
MRKEETSFENLLKTRTYIKDPVHKLIPINFVEYKILQHPLMLRLHGIKQLGFTYLVYPQAKHSRFEHSLGAMHVAGMIWTSFMNNSPGIISELFPTSSSRKDQSAFYLATRISALLHDVGHLPYSHVTESALETAYENGELPEEMNEIFEKAEKRKLKLHEYYGCIFSEKLLKDILTGFKKEGFPKQTIKMLSEAFKSVKAVLCRDDDTIEGRLFKKEAHNIMKQIISGEIIDADKIDYLVRDAYNTGATFGAIDIERLISGLMLYDEGGKVKISIPTKIISNLEDLFYARYMMYKWVYLHHKVISLELSYINALQTIGRNWSKNKKKILKVFGHLPNNFWELFHPEYIYKSTTKFCLRIDDSFIDIILRYSLSANANSIVEDVNALLNRKAKFNSIIKREEDLLVELFEVLSSENEKRIKPIDVLEKTGELLQSSSVEILDVVKKTWPEGFEKLNEECGKVKNSSYDTLKCCLEKILGEKINKKLKKDIELTLYFSQRISPKSLGGLSLMSDGKALPIEHVSSIISQINRAGQHPMIFLYSKEKIGKSEESSIRRILAEALIELYLSLRKNGSKPS